MYAPGRRTHPVYNSSFDGRSAAADTDWPLRSDRKYLACTLHTPIIHVQTGGSCYNREPVFDVFVYCELFLNVPHSGSSHCLVTPGPQIIDDTEQLQVVDLQNKFGTSSTASPIMIRTISRDSIMKSK